MIFHLAMALKAHWSVLNVIHYVSVRSILALLSTLFFSLMGGNWFINKSKKLFRSQVREYTPERHQEKNNLPTMGGIFIVAIVVLNILLWTNLTNPQVWTMFICLLLFGFIGGWDDWLKIRYKRGLSAKLKFILQILAGIVVVLIWLSTAQSYWGISIPFFKDTWIYLGYLFIPWAVYMIVGFSNAVNLTDGLDGLAIGSLIPNFTTFAFICYVAGHAKIAAYLHIPFAATSEIAVIGTILVGASIGFLWYNAYPAQIFMGDVGSLSLGAALALMSLMAKQELLLLVAGGLFVFETVSVILQIFSYRVYKKKLFKMAPIHHHFELIGWPEAKITTRFGIVTFILCLLALITLKLR